MVRNHERAPHAVVVGLDCMTGLQTARILARHSVPVIGIASDGGSAFCRTRMCEKILVADTSTGEVVERLAELGPTLPSKAVLYPCSDNAVLQILYAREDLENWYRVVLPKKEVVELLIDKVAFCTYAAKHGLPIPPTFFLRERKDAEQAAKELRFPCILKPPMRSATWEKSGAKKVYRLSGSGELLSVYDHHARLADMLMVQEWIPGTDADLYSCNCYLNSKSEALVTFVARKIRQWPPEAGTSSLGEECRNDTVLQTTLDLFRNVGYVGLGYLEMKRHQTTGEHLIIEPNVGRPTGRSAIAEAGGVDLLYTMYCDALGWPLPEARMQTYKGVKWMYFRRDLQSAFYYWRKGQLTFRGWLRSVSGPKTDAVFCWNDLRPFIHDFAYAFKKAAREGAPTPEKLVVPVLPLASNLPTSEITSFSRPVDFDVHGVVGVRLVNATESDVKALRRQLGSLESPLNRVPDIVLRFCEHIPATDLRTIELGRSGACDGRFYVFEAGPDRAKAAIPFDRVGGKCEILCERGIARVPFLMAIVNLTALRKHCVLLHASAFLYNRKGVLVTGWSKGGKTEALLAFAQRGASYVGDEWMLLSESGQQMYGIPEDIRVWDWHLQEAPHLRRRVNFRKRVFFGLIHTLARAQRHLDFDAFPFTLLRDAMPALQRQLNARLGAEAIFAKRVSTFSADLQKVFLMANWQLPETTVERVDPEMVASRMMWSNEYEQLPLTAAYKAFRFAFPDRRNEFLERSHEVQAEILKAVLMGKDCYVVWHPYRAPFLDLYNAMAPLIESTAIPILAPVEASAG
jgi:predicted ATP-grasp superfamily ATP-dependent carboligase